MAIVIFGDTFSFPEGNAATNRVYTYAKGFIENNINTYVICFSNDYLVNGNGIAERIHYFHPLNQIKRNNSFLIRNWYKQVKFLNTIILIRRINKEDKIEAIITYTKNSITHLFSYFLARIVNTKLIIETSEHPLRDHQGSFYRKILGDIKTYLNTIQGNGIFCISKYLMDFYKVRGVNPKKLFLVPSTVDTERFRILYNSPLEFPYILYCGSLAITKDGVDILIESFTKISEKYPEINLVLLGSADTHEEEMFFKDLAATLKIDKRVFFLGKISRTDVPAYLGNAKILTLARPNSIVADAGFPSKLTEYLATGRPVVVTKVGEIPVYLKDNENAFLSEPDSVDAFANKLDYVLDNYEFAQQVGEKGKELTTTVFNYSFQAKRIIDFVRSL